MVPPSLQASLDGPLWPWLIKAGLTLLRRPALSHHQLCTNFYLGPAPLAALPAYRDLLGFAGATLPLCWFYPLLQKAQLASMLQIRGLPVAGLIHLRNTLQLHSVSRADLLAALPHAGLSVQTELQLACHEGAWLLSVQQRLYQGGDAQLLLQGSSDYLVQKSPKRRPASASNASPISNLSPAALASAKRQPHPALSDQAMVLCQWQTHPALARRYAALSGDWNPIHLWQWSARLFGQRGAILHGMASAALLEARLPMPVSQLQLEFLKPLQPGQPLMVRQCSDNEFWLCSQDRACLRALAV